jgi:exosortase
VAGGTKHRILRVLAPAGFVLCFWPVLQGLVESWAEDPDLAFGFLVPPISAALLHRHRRELAGRAAQGPAIGLAVVLFSTAVFIISYVACTNFPQRVAAWGALMGAAWFLLGSRAILSRPFPFFFLLLAIPPPEVVLGPLRIALKGFATRVSADLLALVGWGATAEGNILVLDDLRLEVADACSGVRSLMAMVASAVLLAHVLGAGWSRGCLLVATAIPLTILLNVLRVVLMAYCLKVHDLDLTAGLRHEALGYGTFAASLAILYGCSRFYEWLLAWEPGGVS